MSDILTAEEVERLRSGMASGYSLDALSASHEALRQQVATLTAENEAMSLDYARLLEQMTSELRESMAERDALREERDNMARAYKKAVSDWSSLESRLAEARAETWKLREVIGRANAAINRWTTDIDTTDAIPFICETLAPILAAPPAETKEPR